jgi:myo-inositol 2-dehydrogenase / D-chiro-inositol 1-dehydrogenase
MSANTNEDVSRRDFLGKAAGTGLLILKPQTVRGSQANSAIRMGLLGCGARGRAVATSFINNTSARYVALADLFPDQLESARSYFNKLAASKNYAGIEAKLLFRGPAAYRELAASDKIDAVHIATPGFFHVGHLDAVVAAGKHVYCEKPMGVDVVQALHALEIGRKAEGRLSLDVGFQIRSAPPFVELVRRIHNGALGKIACISAHYHATAMTYPERPRMPQDELRLRNWYWDRIISGDIPVDQNIHVFDICNWVLRTHPLKCSATGGRNVRSDFGNIWDNFQINFTYPHDVHVSFNSVQFGNKLWDVTERIFGSKGVSDSPYSGPLRITGDEPWEWRNLEIPKTGAGQGSFSVTGEFTDNLAHADREKDKAFIESIVSGKFHNQAAAGSESALTAILARTAAYTGHELTWEDLLRSDQRYELGIDLDRLARA